MSQPTARKLVKKYRPDLDLSLLTEAEVQRILKHIQKFMRKYE
jgi:hypothetical protein